MAGSSLKRKILVGGLVTHLVLSGGLARSVEPGNGQPEEGAAQIQNEIRGVTFFVQGQFVAASGDAFIIRDIDGQEHTVIITKETSIPEYPTKGASIEVEYLENGIALVVLMKHAKE